jgi:hypothetical protein
MTTPLAEIAIDPDALPAPGLPPIPTLPTAGPKREATLRQYAQKLLARLGAPAALLLAAEIDEAAAETESGRWR